VNSVTLDEKKDIGEDGDGESTNANQYVNRDAFGFSLHFFDGDYQAIGTGTQMDFLTNLPSGHENNLYNGNIGDMVVGMTKPQMGGSVQTKMDPQWTSYRYDQLNRIRNMESSTTYNTGTQTWSTQTNGYTSAYTYDGNGNILTLLRKKADGQTIDNLVYHYQGNGTSTTAPGTFTKNQLLHVKDVVNSTVVDYDVDNQINNNYVYDEIGNLIADAEEEIANIVWRKDGKIHEIIRTNGSQKPNLAFMYDEGGTRIAKIVKHAGTIEWEYTHYVRDVSGNVIAIYEQIKIPTDDNVLILAEHTLYGSKRVGVIKQNIDLQQSISTGNGLITKTWDRRRGNKNYELANHLGNVINGVSDLKIRVGVSVNSTIVFSHYEADVRFASDYYPFGMVRQEVV
jgi:hypothetical protein